MSRHPAHRLIAPDLIGMGDSDKIPASAEPDRYRFTSHARYIDAFMDEVVGAEPVALVLHDWGGALGFDWAYRHQQRVRAVAYMETFVAPLTLDDLPESFHPTLKAVRSSGGEALVLDENMFIEKMLPGVTQRSLSADEMAEYRRPFLKPGDGRWPTLQWPREVPLSGDPADVHDRIFAYSTWLNTAPLPKLFIDADPGVFLTGRVRKLAKNFPNQHHVVVKGLHFVQEDSPDGSVATILTKDARRWRAGSDRSCDPVEQVGDKGGLAADIMTVNLSNLSLPHHRHGLETRQRLPRRTETAEAEPRPDKALDTPVVLLDDVVQIFTLSQTSAAP